MKRLFLALTLAIAMPAVATAQQDPGPPNTPSPAMRAQMRADMQQMVKLHQQFRAQVLGALSPAHRQLLASVVGNLAVSENPDWRAAAKRIDGALSPSESSAILNAEKQMRDQVKSLMEQFRKNHPEAMARPAGPAGAGAWQHRGQRKPHTPDAGEILLGLAGGRGGMMMGWHHGGSGGAAHP
jgi:hypothetical protein